MLQPCYIHLDWAKKIVTHLTVVERPSAVAVTAGLSVIDFSAFVVICERKFSSQVEKCMAEFVKMERDIFLKYFTKIYYLYLKEYKKASLREFTKVKTNKVYKKFFEKLNKCKFVGLHKFGDNSIRRKRAFERFKYTVSRMFE